MAERLDGLPLALATAGAFLGKSTVSFQQYLDAYERDWNVNPHRLEQLQDYQERTLYTTWNLTYRRLQHDDAEAAQVLQLMAYFDHQAVWYQLLRGGLSSDLPEGLQASLGDQMRFESVMATLVEYCLVDVQHASQSYSMHSCVHDWTLGELNAAIRPELYWYAFDCVSNSIDKADWTILDHVKYSYASRHGI